MQRILLLVVRLYVTAALLAASCAQGASPFPLQLELRVPFDPTAFPSAGRTFLMYEVYLTNFTDSTIDLRRIEVLDADGPAEKPLAVYDGEQIGSLLQAKVRQVNAGATIVMFLQVAIETGARMPNLHFEVTTSATPLAGEGVPYVFNYYRVNTAGDTWQARTHELPMRGMLIDFQPMDAN